MSKDTTTTKELNLENLIELLDKIGWSVKGIRAKHIYNHEDKQTGFMVKKGAIEISGKADEILFGGSYLGAAIFEFEGCELQHEEESRMLSIVPKDGSCFYISFYGEEDRGEE